GGRSPCEEQAVAARAERRSGLAARRTVAGHRVGPGRALSQHHVFAQEPEPPRPEPGDLEAAVHAGAVQHAEVAVQAHERGPRRHAVRPALPVARQVEGERAERAGGALAELMARVVLELLRIQLALEAV